MAPPGRFSRLHTESGAHPYTAFGKMPTLGIMFHLLDT